MPKSKTNPKPPSARATAACEEYCALGPTRSLLKLAKHLKERPDWLPPVPALYTLEHWSAAFGWQERARAYDAERAKERAAQRDAEIEAMNARHAKIGTTQQARAIEQIQALIAAQAFGSQAAVQLLKLATDLERTARGVPQKMEISGKMEVTTDARDVLAAKLATLAERTAEAPSAAALMDNQAE